MIINDNQWWGEHNAPLLLQLPLAHWMPIQPGALNCSAAVLWQYLFNEYLFYLKLCWWPGTCGPEEDDAHGKESLKKIECFNK